MQLRWQIDFFFRRESCTWKWNLDQKSIKLSEMQKWATANNSLMIYWSTGRPRDNKM